MENANPVYNVHQLAGPGAEGMEHDTPLFHFDVLGKDLPTLLADPLGHLTRAGVGPEKGIAPSGTMSVELASTTYVWSQDAWQKNDDPGQVVTAEDAVWCCYALGERTICHRH